jgi:hypothetical protein
MAQGTGACQEALEHYWNDLPLLIAFVSLPVLQSSVPCLLKQEIHERPQSTNSIFGFHYSEAIITTIRQGPSSPAAIARKVDMNITS